MESLEIGADLIADLIKGRKPVLDALKNNVTINKLYISKTAKGEIISTIFRLARRKGIVFSYLERKDMDKKAGDNNQGVFVLVSPTKYADFADFEEILRSNKLQKKNTIFCILDSVTDPHNVGAIIRSAYAFGIDGIILPKRNACQINATVVKTSSGTANMMPILQTNNLVQMIEKLKEKGLWVIGTDTGGKPIKELDLSNRDLCFVMGSEGRGMKRLVKEKCDTLVSIPMKNKVDSLNVSCAASVIFYEFTK